MAEQKITPYRTYKDHLWITLSHFNSNNLLIYHLLNHKFQIILYINNCNWNLNNF